jgi:hypothetical protein
MERGPSQYFSVEPKRNALKIYVCPYLTPVVNENWQPVITRRPPDERQAEIHEKAAEEEQHDDGFVTEKPPALPQQQNIHAAAGGKAVINIH